MKQFQKKEEKGFVDTSSQKEHPVLEIRGEGLSIKDMARVSRGNAMVRLTDDPDVLSRIRRSREVILDAIEQGDAIYGVTTVFGGMANIHIVKEEAEELQNNIAWPHKTGAGKRLPADAVRAAMLLRANSMMKGASGVRLLIIERLVDLINQGVCPHVYEWGSIGASGDLVPLAYILGAAVGLDTSFKVSFDGEENLDSLTALKRLGLPRIHLEAKEGLSVMNGTSVMTGIAAHCVQDVRNLTALSLGVNALFFQALEASAQSFYPYVQRMKPHVGQIWSAKWMLQLLDNSCLIRDGRNGPKGNRPLNKNDLVQDRYSLRCLPQYMGPIVDGLSIIARQVETEMNSAADNPLVDPEAGEYLYCGNFLGQYIGVAMDQLRYFMGLLAKHLDVQIAMLTAPEFNRGLSPSLVGNTDRRVNIGLKGLQLSGNSLMPLLSFFGSSLVDRFPTHAEQFNQNINSLGFGSANLARQAVDMLQHYMAMAIVFGVQAAGLRTRLVSGHYDARKLLSPATSVLYESVFEVTGAKLSPDRPYVWDDDERPLDEDIRRIRQDIVAGGPIPMSVEHIAESLEKHNS
jgi:phenylalanine ammonia-lyase